MILLYDNQVLFKLVVITVLVIAESADNCIKTVILTFVAFSFFPPSLSMCFPCLILFAFQMLRNCKVARVLPRIADCAKNDRNAVLRARYDYQFFYSI